MKEKLRQFMESQYPVSILFLIFGILLIAMPVATLDIICKVVFGLALILAGALNIISQARSSSNKGLLHLYTGSMSVIVGIFLFSNPQIVVKLLPWILGAFVLADCLWIAKEVIFLRKNNGQQWETYTVVILAFIVLAVLIIVNPFGQIRRELVFAGWVLALKGIFDIILSLLIGKQKKRILAGQEPGYNMVPVDGGKKKFHLPTFHGRGDKKEKAAAASDDIIDVETQAVDEDVIYGGQNQQPVYQSADYAQDMAEGAAASQAGQDAAYDQADGVQDAAYYEADSVQDAAYDNAAYGQTDGGDAAYAYDEAQETKAASEQEDSWVEE